MKTWQLQKAKDGLCTLIERAAQGEPQRITRHGVPAVTVISCEEYDRLAGKKKSLAALIRSKKYRGAPLEIERSKDLTRDVEL